MRVFCIWVDMYWLLWKSRGEKLNLESEKQKGKLLMNLIDVDLCVMCLNRGFHRALII